jgi:hypothetical protein
MLHVLVALALTFGAQAAVSAAVAAPASSSGAAPPRMETSPQLKGFQPCMEAEPCSVMDLPSMPAADAGISGGGVVLMLVVVVAEIARRYRSAHGVARHCTRRLVLLPLPCRVGVLPVMALAALPVALARPSCASGQSPSSVNYAELMLDRLPTLLCALLLLLVLRKLGKIHMCLRDFVVQAALNSSGGEPVCKEAQDKGTEPSAHWADVAGRWVVDRTEGDVDGVLGLVGYGTWPRTAFKLAQYGRGVAHIDITMHSARSCTLTFGGGPMPPTTNSMRVDGTVQTFIGNEGIPGDDQYTVAMWWEGDAMVAWGEHKSGRFPRMDTRRYLRDGLDGKHHSELVVERTVEGVFSRMIYVRRS